MRIRDFNNEITQIYSKLAQSPTDQLLLNLLELRKKQVSDEAKIVEGIRIKIENENVKLKKISDEATTLYKKIASLENDISSLLNNLPVSSQKLDALKIQLTNTNLEIADVPEALSYVEKEDIVIPEQILMDSHKTILKYFPAVMDLTTGKIGIPEGQYNTPNSQNSGYNVKIIENTLNKIVYTISFTQKGSCSWWDYNRHVPLCMSWNYDTISHNIVCEEFKMKCRSGVGYDVDHINKYLIIGGIKYSKM